MNATENRNRAALLDRAALHVRRAELSANLACAVAISKPETAREQSRRAIAETGRALNVLVDHLGAALPSLEDAESDAEPMPTTTGDTLDLNALTRLVALDTPKTRALLTALETVQALAQAVDEERGNVLPGHIGAGPNGTTGTDYSESVNMLCHRLRGELHGTAGRDR